MVRECGWRGLGGAEGLEPLRAPEQSLWGLPLLSRLAVTMQFGISVVNGEALELAAPVLENSSASCRGNFGHGLTLALVLDHGTPARAGSGCQTANPLPLPAEGRELCHSLCS